MRIPFVTCALVLSATAFAAVAQVAPPPLDATLRAARNLIDEGRATEALAMLGAADAGAASTRGQARLAFFEGRAHDKLGDEEKAIAAYEHAIAVEPSYGAALNNLALLLSRRGDPARAVALLEQAVALTDPRRPLYLNNYAAASEKAGHIDAARRAYAQLAAAQPDNVDAQLHSIRLLDEPRRMALQLMKLSNRGEVSAAQSLALDLLARPFDAAGKRALLSVVAGTLVAQHIDPRRFGSLPVSSRLENLRGDPLIADGIAEILLLYGGTVDPARYRWWRSPRDERFAALIRDIGASATADDRQHAEACFKLALEYADGTDADAFVELADLYYSRNLTADLDALAKRYEKPMFAAKSDSAASADYAAEYRLHVALGTMYAYLQRWGSVHDPASAIFQLTEARRAAADFNRTVKWGPRIPNDPKTIELLANSYGKSGDLARSLSIRVDAASAFVAEGRKTAARTLLKPIDADPAIIADAAVRQQYGEVVQSLAKPIVIETTIEFPDSVQVAIALATPTTGSQPPPLGKQISGLLAKYVLAESDDERDRAEDTLRKLGVSDLEPTTMSRVTGEFVVEAGGKASRYRYTVRGE
jgi:tetratricopeptide (TPR) repeat protein